MAQFSIESNGRLEDTAIYFNGKQIEGVKEIFLNLDEDGTFDSIIQYEGSDGVLYSKDIFNDYLANIKTRPPAYSEEDTDFLQLLTIESNGNIEQTFVFRNEEEQFGIVSLLIHVKGSGSVSRPSLKSIFSSKKNIPDIPEFKVEITYREDNGSLTTENVF